MERAYGMTFWDYREAFGKQMLDACVSSRGRVCVFFAFDVCPVEIAEAESKIDLPRSESLHSFNS